MDTDESPTTEEPTETDLLRAKLQEEIQQGQELARALLAKAEAMLHYPLAKTVRSVEGQITEVHPAKWSMADATRLLQVGKDLLAHNEQQQRELGRMDMSRLPEWVPTYLAAWGSPRPDGKKMTVAWASSLAGTSASNVRNLRQRSRQFVRMETMARFGTAATMGEFIEAGLRGNVGVIWTNYMRLVKEGNVSAILKGVEWTRGKASKVEMMVSGGPQTVIYLPDNKRDGDAEEAAEGDESATAGDDSDVSQ